MTSAVRPDWERRSLTGSALMIAGGAVATIGSFLPWLRLEEESFTGWKLYDLRDKAGDNPFIIDKMFKPTFDPFVTGAVTLFLGALVAFLGVLAFALPKRPPPSRFRTSPWIYVPAMLASILLFLVVVGNVASVVRAPEGVDVGWGVGLFVVAVAALVALIGTGMAGAATRSQLAAGPAGPVVAVQPPAGPPPAVQQSAAPPAGWYPDPEGRHQQRFWDGRMWTTHVNDQGAPSEDPVLTSR
jgi:hypothetical protein